MAQRTGDQRPGGRTSRTRHAVHTAVLELVTEHGSGPVGVAEIASRAGVHPATIYRRWRSAEALVLEVAVDELNRTAPLPVSGDLRADLTTYARSVAAGITRPGGMAFLRAITAAAADPGTGVDGAAALVASRLDQIQRLLDEDEVDGRAGTLDAIDVIDGLLAPVYFRALLSTPTTLTARDLDRLVDNLVVLATHQTPDPHRGRGTRHRPGGVHRSRE